MILRLVKGLLFRFLCRRCEHNLPDKS